MRLNCRKSFNKKAALLFLLGATLLFWMFAGCSHKIDTSKIVTTRDIIRFLIRTNPGIFSNSFLDTARIAVAGTDFSFSRNYSIKTVDTCFFISCDFSGCDSIRNDSCILINDFDTIPAPGGGVSVLPRSPRDASSDLLDSWIGQLQIDSAGLPKTTKQFQLPVTKFGYFQKLQNDAYPNRGWYLMGATQTFVGVVRLIDSVRIQAVSYPKGLSVVRQSRNPAADPLDDPQVVKVRTSPFQLKPNDSVEVRVWVRNTLDSILYVFCHISDLNTKRRIQLAKRPSDDFFLGGFKLSPEVYYDYRRLIVDAITNTTLTDPSTSTVHNEIWGIIYQVYP